MNSCLPILHSLSAFVAHEVHKTLDIYLEFASVYQNEKAKIPFQIDILSDVLHDKNLKETAHSRVLYRLLHDINIRELFIRHFLPHVTYSSDTIQIPYPDKNRIDLTIKCDGFFLIIENKVNKAQDRTGQIEKYIKIAKKTYPIEQIYVIYLNKDTNTPPSEFSLSSHTREILGNRFICKNYKDDIIPWLKSICEQVDFSQHPLLRSALTTYTTYLENKFQIENQYNKTMNNNLDKKLIEILHLESVPLSEKIKIIEDQKANVEIILNRLSSLLEDYQDQSRTQNINKWYRECTSIFANELSLTMESCQEFGFNFTYRKRKFRCCVSFDDGDCKPYWGIYGINEDENTCPKIFAALREYVLHSNSGFHNCEENSECWVVSDYEKEEFIVERYISLTRLIQKLESCKII